MYKLADRRAAVGGIYCGAHGVWLGPAQLIRRNGDGRYQVRAVAEIEALLAAAYAAPPEAGGCIAGLQRIAKHLADSNVALAMIAAVQLRFGEIAEERIERLARADTLLKANFNPDEPRDDHGRWTDATEVDPDRAESEGSSGGDLVPTSAGGNGPAVTRAWEQFPNADFRDRLAEAEHTATGKDLGYGEMLDRTDPQDRRHLAFGRYQLTPAALQAVGLMDRSGDWTGKYGIHSAAQFLADPEAQEQALTDYLDDLQRQLQATGAFSHIGETIGGIKARFPVTRAGIIAAAHREGAPATRDYLNRIAKHRYTSKGLVLSKRDLAIETRLRSFSDASYR